MRTCTITVFGILCFFTCVFGLTDFPVTKYSLIDTTTKNTSNIFKIGLLGFFIGNDAAKGVTRFAIEQINSDTSLLPDCLLQMYFCQTDGSKAQALIATETLIQEYNISALVGARTSDETEISNIVASIYAVPQIGAISVSPALSDKSTYSYFMRVNPPAQYQDSALISLMTKEKWSQVFVIYSNDPYGQGGLQDLEERSAGLNMTFYSSQITNGGTNFSTLIQDMRDSIATNRVRIFVLYVQVNDGLVILNQINAAGGLIGNTTNNLFVMMDAITVGFITNQYDIFQYPYLQGSVGVVARGPVPGTLYTNAVASWNAVNATRFPGVRPDPTQSWYYYDAVYTIARALDNLLKVKPLVNVTGKDMMTVMTTNNFTGITGRVTYDTNYDRKGDYVWYNFRATFNDSFAPDQLAAIYSPINDNTTYTDGVPLVFNGKLAQPDGLCPCLHGTCDDLDVCHCAVGFSGDACDTYSGKKSGGFDTKDYVLVVLIPVVVIGVVFAAALQFVRHKRRALIKDMSEKQRALIKRSDIALYDRIGRGASGEVFKGMFRGTEVAVKKVITTGSSSATTEQFEMECAIMTALRHPNIVLFMGMCLLPENNELLLVMELMERGSLHDIIHNPKIQLSQSLCLHIAYQAAKGMNFLHQSDPPIIHCDLKSHNILMDDKWNARISDFGITRFKKLGNNKKTSGFKGGASSVGTIYWTAPEVFAGSSHMEASDCYSFGVVLWELFHRETPYGGKEPMLVANEVQNNVRPNLKPDIDPAIRNLITDCWAAEPSARPTFETIMNRLRTLNQQNPLTSYGSHEVASAEAPTGTVYLVATEIVGSSELWEESPLAMAEAVKMHNKYIRLKIENNDGYEVECTQSGFLIAFRSVKDSINFCILAQMGLLHLEWPMVLLNQPAARVERDGSQVLHAGLQVRMIVHTGVPGCQTDPHGRMKYIGPVVDRTRKLLAAPTNGSVIVTNPVMDHINTKGVKFSEEISVVTSGEALDSTRSTLSARNKPEKLYDILPKPLVGRRNLRHSDGANAVPNAVVMDIDDELDAHQANKNNNNNNKKSNSLAWDIRTIEMVEKESIGKGAIGDYVRTSWKGKEVLQKVLLNQQVGEDDLLVLKAHAAVLTKVQHKNLLSFYGVCLEPTHISLIIEYLPKALGLNALLSDSSIALNFATKVRLARQVAEGMDHLGTVQGHPWLSIHGNLKSNNVLVEKDMTNVKICDFGQGNLKDLARTMTSVGTVAWTAPELLNGDEATPKISIYAFGIIMWEIYTRQFPYSDEHPIRVVAKIVCGHRPTVPNDCPEKYKQLMTQCWAQDPDQRPSWGEILSVLSSF